MGGGPQIGRETRYSHRLIVMEEKTLNALRWIVDILDSHEIPYRIGGGFAAHVYGSTRPVNDIDISLSGTFFPIIMPEVAAYVSAELKHYSGEKWDCDGFSLDYHGQEIDISDIDTLRMSDLELTKWFQTKDHFRMFPSVLTNVDGIEVSLIDPHDLVAYKRHLADRDYQLIDIAAVQKYIADHTL